MYQMNVLIPLMCRLCSYHHICIHLVIRFSLTLYSLSLSLSHTLSVVHCVYKEDQMMLKNLCWSTVNIYIIPKCEWEFGQMYHVQFGWLALHQRLALKRPRKVYVMAYLTCSKTNSMFVNT